MIKAYKVFLYIGEDFVSCGEFVTLWEAASCCENIYQDASSKSQHVKVELRKFDGMFWELIHISGGEK